jgi:hypothetical protein
MVQKETKPETKTMQKKQKETTGNIQLPDNQQ